MDLILEPGRAEKNYWRDLWRYRELFFILAWRDIAVRYKQTVIGVVWAVLRPLLTTIVFTVVFSKIAGLHAPPDVPYALFVMIGNLPWQFFATSMSEASNSLIGNANLISKIYFLWYHFLPDWRLLALPLFMLLAFGASFGIGLWLCALNVEYRDFRYIVPFIVQFGFFLAPVGYDTSLYVPVTWLWHGHDIPARLLYSLNPMVGVIDGFRWSLLAGKSAFDLSTLLTSVSVTVALLGSGLWYFRKMEKTFADVI